MKYAETSVARAMNAPVREPLLDAEVINAAENYNQPLSDAFGSRIESKTSAGDPINSYLHDELTEITDIYEAVEDSEGTKGSD